MRGARAVATLPSRLVTGISSGAARQLAFGIFAQSPLSRAPSRCHFPKTSQSHHSEWLPGNWLSFISLRSSFPFHFPLSSTPSCSLPHLPCLPSAHYRLVHTQTHQLPCTRSARPRWSVANGFHLPKACCFFTFVFNRASTPRPSPKQRSALHHPPHRSLHAYTHSKSACALIPHLLATTTMAGAQCTIARSGAAGPRKTSHGLT